MRHLQDVISSFGDFGLIAENRLCVSYPIPTMAPLLDQNLQDSECVVLGRSEVRAYTQKGERGVRGEGDLPFSGLCGSCTLTLVQ